MLRLSDLVTSRKSYYNHLGESVSQLWNTVGRRNLECTFFTNKHNFYAVTVE